jgi:hypothetical protein
MRQCYGDIAISQLFGLGLDDLHLLTIQFSIYVMYNDCADHMINGFSCQQPLSAALPLLSLQPYPHQLHIQPLGSMLRFSILPSVIRRFWNSPELMDCSLFLHLPLLSVQPTWRILLAVC